MYIIRINSVSNYLEYKTIVFKIIKGSLQISFLKIILILSKLLFSFYIEKKENFTVLSSFRLKITLYFKIIF